MYLNYCKKRLGIALWVGLVVLSFFLVALDFWLIGCRFFFSGGGFCFFLGGGEAIVLVWGFFVFFFPGKIFIWITNLFFFSISLYISK